MRAISYSGMQLFAQCPYRFHKRYTDQADMQVKEKVGPAAQRGTIIHNHIEDYLKGKVDELSDGLSFYADFLATLKAQPSLEPESRWAFTPEWEATEFDSVDDAFIRGIMDASLLDGETAYVYEWKTGKEYPGHDDQRGLYGLVGLLKYPQATKVITTTVYLDQNYNRPSEAQRASLMGNKWLWSSRIRRCTEAKSYPKRPGNWCGRCPYSHKNGGACGFPS